jgi:nitroreductase
MKSESTAIVDDAIVSRRSIRAFLPKPVAREDIEAILETAARAPSGTNIQPWKVTVLTGESLRSLSAKILAAHDHPDSQALYTEPYPYYPKQWMSPYLERRRKVGWDLYGLLGLTRDDKAGMHAQHGRNYAFFDAPVGLMFTIDRVLQLGSWLDYGMFLQALMIAARGRGLDTCPQAAFNRFHRVIGEHIGMPDTETLVCGMSLGYADPSRIENTLVTERESVKGFVRFMA